LSIFAGIFDEQKLSRNYALVFSLPVFHYNDFVAAAHTVSLKNVNKDQFYELKPNERETLISHCPV